MPARFAIVIVASQTGTGLVTGAILSLGHLAWMPAAFAAGVVLIGLGAMGRAGRRGGRRSRKRRLPKC